ncbi:MAG TPA: aminotransferase class IV [Methylomirabilota bacterium]|jgi:branched-chain amino acid aminotransferase|nr:aminotransferase class IV [Methylomirabilota bacterium]
MADYTAYFCGEWVPFSQVRIDPLDRGFLVGDCVFDVARTFNGKSFRMREHVDRLYRSLKYVRIDPGLSPDEMEQISEEVISRNEHLRADVGDYQIWQFVTRGRGRWAHKAGPPAVGVCTRQIGFSRFAHLYRVGAHGVIVRTRSFAPDALDPKVKNFSRMNFNMAELEASDVDPDSWPILTDSRGSITEGVGYNLFIVTDGVIRTAGDRGVLQGVSRAMVFELAEELGIATVVEDFQPYDVYTADEAFFTSTSPCVLPVTRVDRRPIGRGTPGPVAARLLEAWSQTVGVDIVAQAERYAPLERLESRSGS